MNLMLRRTVAFLCLAIVALPLVVAEEPHSDWNAAHEFVWEHDFGGTYISTAPVFLDERLLVRTSGGGQAAVSSFDFSGNLVWSHANPNSNNHDMSPLKLVRQGQGACGSWDELVLVGWTDGTVDALDAMTGSLVWSNYLNSSAWGVTGHIAIDGEFAVVSSSLGVGKYCLADGEEQWWVPTGFGWRNGVSVHSFGYALGDEAGNLWTVARNGSTNSYQLDSGKIRHAPIMTEAGLFIHSQLPQSSTILVLDPTNFEVIQNFTSGPSPAVPTADGTMVLTGDSSAVQLFECRQSCELIGSVPFRTNGELGSIGSATYMAAMNAPNAEWGVFTLNQNRTFAVESVDLGLYGYGTAGPGFMQQNSTNFLAVGNDGGVVRFFRSLGFNAEVDGDTEVSEVSEVTEVTEVAEIVEQAAIESIDWRAQGFVFILYVLLGSIGVQFLRGSTEWLLRTSSLFFLVLLLMVLPDLSAHWSEVVSERLPSESVDEEWNASWPDEWLDTQIVIFEFEDGHRAVGGLQGSENVYQLTQAACRSLGIDYGFEETGLGIYIESFDGLEANGWEYAIDGSPGVRSVDSTAVEAASIVRWSPA
ncbi:MAG: hypothetical protein CMA63_03335 [Euryarchaeota archaeon]|nr:hypothetical protein [Euryarchaeota archaeon]